MSISGRRESMALAGLSPPHRLQVTLSFLPNDKVKQQLTAEFRTHLPLRDLVWRSSSRAVIRTIEDLELDFTDYLESVSQAAKPMQIPYSLLDKPYLHLLFVICDDNDQYRATLRQQIRDWLDGLHNRRQSEWLIVHVTAQRSGPRKFYQTKGSVFDKIRADFNVGKRDRCIQLPTPGSTSEEDTASWKEFIAKVKELLVASIDAQFSSYEEDVRKVDAQRQMPGWNFCTFFVQKEGLAQSFEAMNLLEDALLQYDELEASYVLAGKGQSLPWFSRIGGTEPGDDALSIFDVSSKPFRQLISQNNISIFDFRIYLFARQASLTMRMGQVAELAKRGRPFIYNLAKMMRSHGGALQRYFLEYFIFHAAFELVNRCLALVKARGMNPVAVPDLLPLLAELSETACRQAEKIGMRIGFLPRQHPFLMADDVSLLAEGDEEEIDSRELPTPSDGLLRNMLESEEAFDRIFRNLLEQSLQTWLDAGRGRSAFRIRGSLAAVEHHRKSIGRSQELYEKLASQYSGTRWVAIESQILRQEIALQALCDQKREELLTTLALLKTGMRVGSLRWTVGLASGNESDAATSVLSAIKRLSHSLDRDLACNAFPTFSTRLTSSIGLCGASTSSVCLDVYNHLPCALEVDDLRFKLVNPATMEVLWLTVPPTNLRSGVNTVRAVSPQLVSGTFALDLSQIRLGKIVFQYSPRFATKAVPPDSTSKDILLNSTQGIVRFAVQHAIPEIRLEGIPEIRLDEPRQFLLTIDQRTSQMSRASVRFSTPISAIQFRMSEATLVSNNCVLDTSPSANSLSISGIRSPEPLQVLVPFDVLTQDVAVEIPITLEYGITASPELKRFVRAAARVQIALPLAVNVQDFFRDDCVLSRFTVTTNDAFYIKVKQATLSQVPGWRIEPCVPNRENRVVLSANTPAGFIFRMTPEASMLNSKSTALRVEFQYRTFRTESTAILLRHLQSCFAIAEVDVSLRARHVIRRSLMSNAAFASRLERDMQAQPSKAKVAIGSYTANHWRDHLRSFHNTDEQWQAFDKALRLIHDTPLDISKLDAVPWYTLSIPLDLPSMMIFNRVTIHVSTTPNVRIRTRDLLQVAAKIRTSYRWAMQEDQQMLLSRRQRLVYEVTTNPDDWAIAGRRRGELCLDTADQGAKEFDVAFHVLPLRPGMLFIPSIRIYAIPDESEAHSATQEQTQNLDFLPSCETFHDNAAVSIEVTPADVGTASVCLDRLAGEVLVDA